MKARIATVCQAGRFYSLVEKNREYVMGLLDLALRQKPDLVCLPEAFTSASVDSTSCWDVAESVYGPTINAAAERAKAGKCYIICPVLTKRNSKVWNSAVILDRKGEILGTYDKLHPVTSSSNYTVFEKGITPGSEAHVFDLDFGRIGIQICFDVGFPESWKQLSKKDARIVFWPSAYNGGFPLQVYAYLHHYWIVSSVRSDRSRIVDPCGRILAETDWHINVICRDINLDFMVAHYDFNYSIPDKIMERFPGQVEVRSYMDDAHFLLEPRDNGLTIERLQSEFKFETTFLYHERHRRAYRLIHKGKKPRTQKAAHGERPQYAKEE